MNSTPIIIKEYKKKHLFGLIKINYLIEDRRPDLEKCISKYKHFLILNIFFTQYSWIFRTKYSYDELPFKN